MAATAPKPSSAWLALAIGSGACAAFNGMFAKLTTTSLTTSWSHALLSLFNLSPDNKVFEFSFRGFFFLLNLLFDAIMWGLFTRALTLAFSTVRVSIINTTSNFMTTAILGALIFGESLPGLWWLGAAMMIAGSVIIGKREEKTLKGTAAAAGAEGLVVGSGSEEERVGFLDNPERAEEEADDDDAVELATVPEVGSEDESEWRR
ncbi:Transcription initiation factor iia small subunit [Lasiodiplodia theobromae]|uniref:Transcription initiation factor iia small subunit n=1 Tax=Lasiodiplodia theobromae TaxID=45133 RepID=UPI0015C2F4EC|nr:Transcription initiation factor iia small subunit [Lasiodiplodia theobromae]KAF4542230.1 Transcription initiation factor iia small subunit [Lasiodiplodia theobromae]